MRQGRHWKGKRVANQSDGSITEFYLDSMLGSLGLGPGDIRRESLGRNEALAALVSGRVDAMINSFATEPDFGDRASEIVSEPLLAGVIGDFQYGYIIFGARMLDADIAAAARFLTAYYRGAREYKAGHTPKFLEDWVAVNLKDPRAVERICRDSIMTDARFAIGDLQRFVDWNVWRGYIPAKVPAADLVDLRALELASKSRN
jgi:ABC-type nitrate/sulfonate/bicarbonate transport system substrate-binding protein